MFRRLNATTCRGTRSYRDSATTSGTRIRNETATIAGSSPAGRRAAHCDHVWSVNVSGSTTRARSLATRVSERATVATPTGTQSRLSTSVGRSIVCMRTSC